MSVIQASFSSLPNETLDEIARLVAGRGTYGSDRSSYAISQPYKDLCSLRLVDRRCNAAAAPQLLRWVLLDQQSESYYGRKSRSGTKVIPSFASLARSNPALLGSIEILVVRFHNSYEEGSKSRDVAAERMFAPGLSAMVGVRQAFFDPFMLAPTFLGALHPEARIETLNSIAPEDGSLRLDDPRFKRLQKLSLDLDGDRDFDSPEPNIKLHLPASLTELRLQTSDQYGQASTLALANAVPSLSAVEINGRNLAAEMFAPFFKTQGSHIVSLVLNSDDLHLALDDFYEDVCPEWDDPAVRDDFFDVFNRILPVAALCTHLKTVEIYDVHLNHLFESAHPTLETVVLDVECTMLRLADGMGLEDDFFDSFGKVSAAIQATFERDRFPCLKTIRYDSSKWDRILQGQYYNDYGPWGLQRSLASDDLQFLDGDAVVWQDKLAADEYVDEADEDEDEGEWTDEADDIEEEGEEGVYPLFIG